MHQYNFTNIIDETLITKQAQSSHFQNLVWVFCAFKITKLPEIILNEIIHISFDFESTKKADHILEMSRLAVVCYYNFKNFTSKIRLTNKCSKLYKNLRRLLSRLATVMFRVTPCIQNTGLTPESIQSTDQTPGSLQSTD